MWDRLFGKGWAKETQPKDSAAPLEEPESDETDSEELEWEEAPASVEQFTARLSAVGLGDDADAIVALIRPSLRLVPDEEADDSEAAESAESAESAGLRVGGRPLLAPGVEWPRRKDGAPLSLVAQISLAHVAELTDEAGFPTNGSLAFFCDADDQPWGFSPSDADGWAILHCPDGVGTLSDFPKDLDEEGRFSPVALTPERELTFPPAASFEVEQLVGEAKAENYWSVLGEDDGDETITRFLGHPDVIQNEMQIECQLASNGVYVGDSEGYASPEGIRLRPGAAEWRLLLQVDSHEDVGMMWGDSGRLYWWIRDADLAAGQWGATWLVLQCY